LVSLARIADWAVSLRAETLPDAVRRAAAPLPTLLEGLGET
jgi:hypothetical protein